MAGIPANSSTVYNAPVRDYAITPDGLTLYVAGADGTVSAYNAENGSLIRTWNVAVDPGGLAISPDGSFLMLAERRPLSVNGDQWGAQALVTAYRIDLTTGAVTDFPFLATGYDRGFADVAILSDGKVYFTQDFAGSGWTPLRVLDPATGTYTAIGGNFYQSAALATDGNGDRLLISSIGISDGRLHVYTPGTGTLVEHANYADGVSGYGNGVQAYTAPAGLIARAVGGQVHIFGADLSYKLNLTTKIPALQNATGLGFDATGQNLYAVDAGTGSILQIAVSNWTVVRTIDLPDSATPLSSGVGAEILVGPNARYFLIMTAGGLTRIDNPVVADAVAGTAGPDTLAGTPNADLMYGFQDADSAVGGAGNDTIHGGDGDDTLDGDAGNDMLYGEGGTDTLNGGIDNDRLDGGTGGDTMDGGPGDDVFIVDDAGDLVFEAPGEGNDRVIASVSWAMTADQEIEWLVTSNAAGTEAIDFTGNARFNRIEGNAGANVLNGAGGGDYLYGNAGDDQLDGGDANDDLYGGAGKDTVNGGNGEDRLYIPSASDLVAGEVYDGGAGSDTLFISGGADLSGVTLTSIELIQATGPIRLTVQQADGLAGIGQPDGIVYLANSGTMTVPGLAQGTLYLSDAPGNNISLGAGKIYIYGGVSDDIISVASSGLVDGGAGNDTLTGGDGYANNIRGGTGNDILRGGNGADTLAGGEGIDDVSGGTGNDTIQILNAGELVAGDKMDGGAGQDTLYWIRTTVLDISAATITGIEELRVADPNAGIKMTTAQLVGFQRLDTVVELTTGGSVILAGKAVKGVFKLGPAATVFDATGVQILQSSANTLDVQGGAGDDTITGFGVLKGGNGADKLFVSSGPNVGPATLRGEQGNDELHGGQAIDQLYGGAGDDIYFIDDADQVIENIGEGVDTIRTTLAVLTLAANVEQLVYTGSGAFIGTGNDLANLVDTRSASGNDTLKGMAGVDTLYSGMGNDSLDGGTGIDAMYGGAGDDTYYVDDAGDQAIEMSGEGSDTVRSSAVSYMLGANIETLILTGAAKNGTGNALDNVLIGNGGHNILDGAAGADRMEGGLGDDTYRIDNANDLIVETGVGIDRAITSVSYTLRAGVSVETLTTDNDAGTAALNLSGNELANRVVGNAGANTLHGGGGDDRLEGLDGGDTLWGDAGTDLLIGGNGNDLYVVTDLGDTVIEAVSGGVDRVSLSLATGGVFTLANYVETLVVAGAGIEAHGNAQDNQIVNSATGSSLWGEGGNDTLTGGAVAEALHGGTGNDRITGGAGNDNMWGDAGSDLFVFAAGSGADEVVDFTRGADRIDLTGYGISSLAQVQGMLSQSGANAVIDLGGSNTITLDNILGSQLAASDFVFAPAPPAFAAMAVAEVLLPTNDFLSGGGPAMASVLDW